MAVTKKTLFAEHLDRYNTFVQDTNPNSRYFNITELPDTFTGGKNAFLIAGSHELVADTLIKIEIKDAAGNIIYHEPGEGYLLTNINGESFPIEYYEGVSKVVAVYIYPDTTAYGPCTITILGELSNYYDDNGLLSPIPLEWQGTYNVKWQKKVNVNPTLANTTKVRFYRRPSVSITENLESIYRIENGIKVNSGISQSFANVTVSNINTFAGDVKRVKVYRTSEGDISDYDLIQDILVESKELLTSYELSGSVISSAGFFTSEVLEKLWTESPGMYAELNSTKVDNGVMLVATNDSAKFTYTSSLNLSQNSVYEFGIDAVYVSAVTESNMNIYISGSNNGEVLIGSLEGIVPTKNLKDSIFQFSIPLAEPTASFYMMASGSSNGSWHIGNISLKLSEDTAFSPDEVSFITSMPTVIGNETYNFKFEFYDVNNNYVPVAVTASATFTGGNDNIGGTLIYISSSASSSLAQLNAVSASISGTMTVYSSSADNTIVTLSGSVSGSITTVSGSVVTLSGSVSSSISSLSSSVSSSNAVILSSSLSKVQQLANGQYSGSFIGDTVIYSPAIGGQVGYIKEKFTVGDTSAAQINLDATTSTRRIYIGAGTYNNTNTAIYLDSSGQFSLKDKLTFDTSGNLSVNGTINVTGGNAATSTQVATVGSNAVLSGSAAASTAQTNAQSFASIAATNAALSASAAYTNAKAVADSIAAGTYSGGTLISGGSIISPIIAGADGYFSNTFKVGNAGITLDGSNKAIYIGTGAYNNTNTGFYVDSTGKFSLKDKLTWDGTTLSISGNVSITGGSAATDITNATNTANSAATAASNAATAASNAQTTADGKLSPGTAASDVNSNSTTISGGKIRTGVIESTGYAYSSGNFSTTGTQINLDNGLIRSKNFAITSGGDAIFKGSITGGTITIGSNFAVDAAGNVSATNANLTGTISATAGTIGGWTITGTGYLQNATGKLKINPATPSIEIYDSSDAKRLDIHYGALTFLGSNTIYIDPNAISLPNIYGATGNLDSGYVYSAAASFYVGQGGTYQKQINWDAISNIGYLSNGSNSYLSIGRGVEIRDGSGNVVGNMYAPGASSDFSGDSYLSWPSYNMYASLTFPSSGTYYAYTYYYYYGNLSNGVYADIYGSYWNQGNISLDMENNLVEITDAGIQIAKNPTQYLRFPRDYGTSIIDGKGVASFTGNDAADYAVRCMNDTGGQFGGADALYLYAYDRAIYVSNGNIWQAAGNAFKPGGGSWGNSSSDRRVKQNENELSGSLDIIKALKPKTFEFKNQNRPEIEQGTQIGFIAQDVEEVRPQWVEVVTHKSGSADITAIDPTYYDENKSGSIDIKTISFGNDMTAILVGAIKELTAKIEMLEAKISGSI